MRKFAAITFATLSLAALPAVAAAVPIVGRIDLSGNQVRVTGTTIDWFALGGGNGTITVTGTGEALNPNDYFGSLGPYGSLIGEIDTLLDLNLATAPPGPDEFEPIEGFQTISNTGLNFSLTRIATCAEGGIPQLCLAGLDSPFVFTPLGTGSTISISMSGTVIDTNNPGFLSTWTGNFSADSPDGVQETLALFLSQGFLDLPYSGTKITVEVPPVIPEPASLVLLGSGLVGLAAARRRRNKK